MAVRLVIFDMDGVLVDSHDAWFAAARSLLRMWGEDLTVEEFDSRCWGVPFGSAWRRNGMPIQDMKVAREMLFREYLKELDKVRMCPGAKGALKLLKDGGLKTALLSNTPRWVNEKLVERFGLPLDCIPDLQETKMKPSPEGILFILRELGVAKDEAVFIGDTATDEQTGRSAGVRTLLVGRDIGGVSGLPAALLGGG